MFSCKLTYFNFWALGEPIRLILTYKGVPFIDNRIMDRHGKEWEDAKPSFQFGQLPLLEIDGVSLYQSKAICRYLGNKYKLNGENHKEACQIDIVVDIIYDLIMKMRTLREISDPVENEKKYQEFKSSAIPFCLNNLDSMVKGGHLACGKLTWADFYFTGASAYLSFLCRLNIFHNQNNLKSVYDKLTSSPELTEYLTKRVKCDF